MNLEEQINTYWVAMIEDKKRHYGPTAAPFPYWDIGVAQTHYQEATRGFEKIEAAWVACPLDEAEMDFDTYDRDDKKYRIFLQSVHKLIKKQLLVAITSQSAYIREWARLIQGESSSS